MAETKVVQCGASIEGPKVGRNVVLWRKYCTRKVRVSIDTPDYMVDCWQHRSRPKEAS